MLRSFRLSNHRSFAREQELLLMPTKPAGSADVVPVAAVYGANASGKSNLIDGLLFMRSAVLESFGRWEVDGGVPRRPFRLGVGGERSTFVVELVVDAVPYTYGFTVDDEEVCAEWLYSYPEKRRRKVFEREGAEITFGSTVRRDVRAKLELLEEMTRPNALFLSACANTRLEVVMPVFRWFDSELRARKLDNSRSSVMLARRVQHLLGNAPDKRAQLISLLSAADVAINDVQLEEVEDPTAQRRLRSIDSQITELREKLATEPQDEVSQAQEKLQSLQHERQRYSRATRPELKFVHGVEDEPFALADESAGTRNWLDLLPTVLSALESGQTVVVDEIDASLHPLLTAQLISLFQGTDTNPHRAQLIFTTHDTSLLGNMLDDEVLHRDQVWFVEKDPEGMSELYALSEFRPRKDQNTERRYLGGSYGAVPVLDRQDFVDAVLGS